MLFNVKMDEKYLTPPLTPLSACTLFETDVFIRLVHLTQKKQCFNDIYRVHTHFKNFMTLLRHFQDFQNKIKDQKVKAHEGLHILKISTSMFSNGLQKNPILDQCMKKKVKTMGSVNPIC